MFFTRPVFTPGYFFATAFAVLLWMGVLTASAATGSPEGQGEDFGRYLIDHQAELTPFLDQHGSELLGRAVPLLLAWIGRILLLALLVGWVVDVLLGRGYAALFAPSLNTLKPTLIYATGQLALHAFLLVFLAFAIVAAVGNTYLEAIIIFLLILFGLVSAGLQIAWISHLYRTPFPITVMFYLTLLVVHGFIILGIGTPLAGLPANAAAITFMDQTAAAKVAAEAASIRAHLASIKPARDAVADETTRLQNQIDASRAEQGQLQKQIDEARNSESYLFSQIVKAHAGGDLASAHDRLVALLARFPTGPLTGLVQGQLNQVASELAVQDAQRHQDAANQARLVEQARATLLSRAGKGQATLSELRGALLGKTRAEVSSLFGPPSETGSDRWNFTRQMVFNPLTNEHSGLAVYFADGAVQSVDYYNVTGGAP